MTELSKLKVLIVEDQPESRMILRDILGDLGIAQIYEADDGCNALQYMDGNNADLILCDWNMPVMSGMEFFRTLREKGNVTPFLMVTGRSDHNSIMEARSTGVEGYLRKPFSSKQIETRLRILAARMKTA